MKRRATRYSVMGFEKNLHEGGFRVYETCRGFYDGGVADFEGSSGAVRDRAEVLAASLNEIEPA